MFHFGLYLYHSLMKESPPLKERPPRTFRPIFCIGSKFTRMSAHTGADVEWASHGKWSVLVEFEKHRHAQAPCISVVNKLCVILQQTFLQSRFMKTDIANAACTASYIMLMVTWCHSGCCVPSGLDFEPAGGSIVHYCLSNYLLQGHRVTVNLRWVLF